MRRALRFLLTLAALSASAAALDVPYLSGRVNDDARLLDAAAAGRLERTLRDYEDKTGRQFAVLTLPSLEGEALEDYSLKVARAWGLGRKGKDDGILLLIARDDRKVRIEVGYGLEGSLPDSLCGRIIRSEIVPRFRAGDYAGGISAGVAAVIGSLDGSYAPPPDVPPAVKRSGGNDFARMGVLEKLLLSFFVFGLLGLFEGIGVLTPGFGWFIYFFLIPFWAAFPMMIWGAPIGMSLLAAHLLGFPILKTILGRSAWGKALAKNIHASGSAGYIGGSGRSGGGSGFSGGGGSFGGGGASGSW